MNLYRTDECTFPLPEGNNWLDYSLNIFRNTQDNSSLIVSRGVIPKERTFEEEMDYQWSLLLGSVEVLHSEPRLPRLLPMSTGLHALETDCHFRRGAHIHYQRQLAIYRGERRDMLIFTCTALQPFTDEQNLYWQKLCQSLCLTQS
ncbi:DcrB-related protein [Rahnella selenatireducens]|uniref:DcrB-related protein n=1 Tax=Rahnella selenatireducens TaxID=3389797 RepID=UPI0039690450